MDSIDRGWMYQRIGNDGMLNPKFVEGVEYFISRAVLHLEFMNGPNEIRCPCNKCGNKRFLNLSDVREHLYRRWFLLSYFVWERHGEPLIDNKSTHDDDPTQHDDDYQNEPISPVREMVFHAVGPNFAHQILDEEPNVDAKNLFNMLHAYDEALWPGCEKHSVLSAVARLLNIKSEHHISEKCFNCLIEFIKEALPDNNKLPNSFYETKKLIRGLGLLVEKIDCCVQGCMLFWKADSELTQCKFCGQQRYEKHRDSGKRKQILVKRMYYFPLTPRLRRLYASKATASYMRWHNEHQCGNGEMCHPCDSEAWRQFNNKHPLFSQEPRNVRLGMCIDGFQLYGHTGRQYSC